MTRHRTSPRRPFPLGLVAFGVMGLLLSACADLRYYAHVTHGESALLLHRRPIGKVLRDPSTPPALAAM